MRQRLIYIILLVVSVLLLFTTENVNRNNFYYHNKYKQAKYIGKCIFEASYQILLRDRPRTFFPACTFPFFSPLNSTSSSTSSLRVVVGLHGLIMHRLSRLLYSTNNSNRLHYVTLL